MTRRLALAFLVLSAAGSTLRAQVQFDRSMIPTRSALERVGLERQWMGIIPIGHGADQVIRVSLAQDMVFVQTSAGNFHVYNAENGKYLWGLNLGPVNAYAFPASVNSDRVIVTNLNMLYCLDRGTGQIIWKVRLEKMPGSSTACDEEHAIVGLTDGKVICYSIRDHSKDRDPGRSSAAMLWTWKTNGAISSRPIAAEKVVAFGSQDNRVYVTKLAKNLLQPATLLFRYVTGGPISASMGTFGERTIIAPSEDGNVYAIDLFTADTKWVYSTGSPILKEPLVANNEIFVVNKDGIVTSIDGETGESRWTARVSTDAQLLAVTPARIYGMSIDNTLVIADRATGRVLATGKQTMEQSGLNLTNFTVNMTNRQNDRIYLATPSGLIVCLREAGKAQPTPLRDPNARPFGYLPDGQATPPPAAPADGSEAPADAAAPAPAGEDPFASPPAKP